MRSINGYTVIEELSSHNAGFCQWGFCRKNGREYFIKEFLTPVYPEGTPDLSADILARKRKLCDEYQQARSEYYTALEKCQTGNIILIKHFFRDKTRYYAVTDRVYADGTDPAIIASLSREKKETLIRAILYSFSKLHSEGIVHADVKPDNVLLKKTTDGFYTAKIIDFDAGFFAHKPPVDIQGDFVYLSPEAFLKMNEEEAELSGKMDIFALGILFHQYWTGSLPQIGEDYKYVFEAVLDGSEIILDDSIPPFWKTTILRMLSADPQLRPDAADVLAELRTMEPAPVPTSPERPKTPENASRLIKSSNFYVPTDLD